MADRREHAARVVETFQRYCDVESSAGVETVWRSLPGQRLQPVTGDWVHLERDGPEGRPAIVAIEPRRSELRRTTGARGSGGAVAANVDRALICVPAAPTVSLHVAARLLALAAISGIDPAVVVTKVDEAADLDGDLARLRVVAGPDVRVHPTCAKSGDGLAAFVESLDPGGTYALIGESGAGKSTLLNALAGGDVQRTGALARRGGGRQTTTGSRLVALPNGAYLVDTAGFSDHAVVPIEAVDDAFPTIADLSSGCGFNDCRHDTEPGCAVIASVEGGETPGYLLDLYRALAMEAGAGPRRRGG